MKVLKILFVLILAIVAAMCAAAYWFYSSLNSPHTHGKANEFIKIEKGTSPDQIISKLADEGIISSATATKLYVRTIGDATKLQAGEFQFASPITPIEALKVLEKGEDRTIKLTIPEGFTRFDIAKRIFERFPQEPPMTEEQILALTQKTDLIKDISPDAKDLEGYMYPSTYNIPRDAKPEEIIKITVEQFRKIWKPEWSEKARQMGRTPQEIVTIASLIETESAFGEERPIVASVIYNRLGRNMALGIDQTVVYVAKMQGRWDGTIHKSDIDADSPYNTRKHGGLPPGPISSVSESSINAALNPATTNYIFYVLNVQKNDGSHHFYASAADFERGKAEYQVWLEEQRKIKREQENPN